MIMRIGLYTVIGLMFVVLGGNGRQMPSKPPETTADVQDAGTTAHMWHQRWLTMKHKARLRGEKPKAKWMRFVETWYAQSGKTASGTYTTAGRTVAVDPNVIPLGSKIQVEEDGKVHDYIAEDTGGLVKGRHIDVYDPSVSECLVNGRKEVQVRILK